MRWRRMGLCLVVVFAVLPAGRVAAHATFLGSDPADGSVLRAAPSFIDLHFSEEVLLEASSVTLTRLGPGISDELPLAAADGGTTVRASLPDIGDGAYLVRFVAVDPADLHKTVGTISFGIGVAAPPSEAGAQIDGSWWVVALRALTDGFLIVGVGAVVVIWLAVRRHVEPLDPLVAAVNFGAFGAAIGWTLLFVADVGAVGFAHARWGPLLVSSDPGRRALIGVEVAVGVWWVAHFLRTVTPASRPLIARILAVLAAGMVVLAAMGGHAGVGGTATVGVPLRTLHYGSFSMWIGSIAALWWATRRHPAARALWPPVSRVAAYGLALTGVSGLLLSARVVDTVTALFSTVYGRAVIGKVIGLAVLGLLGWSAGRRVAGGNEPRRLTMELAVAGVVVMLAATLASAAPALGARFEPLPATDPQILTGDVSDLTVSAVLEPGRPGPNLVHVTVLDTRRPVPGPVEQVTVTIARADGTVVASRQGVPTDGTVEWADVDLVGPGSYDLRVQIDRPAQPVPDFTGVWSVRPLPAPRADTVISNADWAPIAALAAVAWACLVAAGRWWVVRPLRDRSGTRSP